MDIPAGATLRVLVIGSPVREASPLAGAVSGLEGVEVAGAPTEPRALLEQVQRSRPDAVLLHLDAAEGAALDEIAALSDAAPRPVVLFTRDRRRSSIRAALRAGVSAYVVDEPTPDRVECALHAAIGLFERDQHLRSDVARARAQLEERKRVERAKGILMRQKRVSEAQAYALLRRYAMDHGVRLGEAAAQIIELAKLLA